MQDRGVLRGSRGQEREPFFLISGWLFPWHIGVFFSYFCFVGVGVIGMLLSCFIWPSLLRLSGLARAGPGDCRRCGSFGPADGVGVRGKSCDFEEEN